MGRRPSQLAPEGPLTVVLTVALSDGSFTSSVTVPVAATGAERDAAVKRWLDIMQFGLKLAGDVGIAQSVPLKAAGDET